MGEFVSVLEVKPAEDLTEAEVRVSILGSPGEQRTAMRGLDAARGYIQTLLGERTQFRNTPQLRFIHDERIQKSMELDVLLQRARTEDEAAADARGEASGPATNEARPRDDDSREADH